MWQTKIKDHQVIYAVSESKFGRLAIPHPVNGKAGFLESMLHGFTNHLIVFHNQQPHDDISPLVWIRAFSGIFQ